MFTASKLQACEILYACKPASNHALVVFPIKARRSEAWRYRCGDIDSGSRPVARSGACRRRVQRRNSCRCEPSPVGHYISAQQGPHVSCEVNRGHAGVEMDSITVLLAVDYSDRLTPSVPQGFMGCTNHCFWVFYHMSIRCGFVCSLFVLL